MGADIYLKSKFDKNFDKLLKIEKFIDSVLK